MKKRVADIVMETLVDRGIVDCFAVVGGGAMFLDNALLHCDKMKKYFNHHEQACAMAAEGYARYSGKMAMVSVTSGPGGTNTLTGVAGAWVDSIPLIVISGQVRYATSVPKLGLKLRTRGVQEFDIVNTVKTMTKYAKLILNPLDIRMEVNKAIDIAMSGRRGPVWLDIPQDVQSAIIEEDDLTPNVVVKDNNNSFDVDEFMELLKEAKRPVFLVGGGIPSSGCRELFRQMLGNVKVPTVASLPGSDAIYRDHNYCFGPIGAVGQRAANFIIQNSDLIVSIGCSLGFAATGFAQNTFAPHAKIISIDVDEEELKKPGVTISKTFVCDLHNFLDTVLNSNVKYECPKEWYSYCSSLKNRFSLFEGMKDKNENDRVSSYYFWKIFNSMIPEDNILILGNNSAITSALQIGNFKKDQHILTNYNCGSMGYDVPAAIGASIAAKKPVILATGDGSVMMNLQEFQTIYHYNVPVKTIIFENQGYNAIRQTSKNFFHGELIGCSPETGVSFPSFKKVADSFDIPYLKCEKNKDLEKVLKEFLSLKGSAILEISQLLDDPVLPKVMSRIDESGKMKSPSLHDMYPFLDEKVVKELMVSEKED